MKKRYVLGLTALLPLAIAFAANQGRSTTPAAELVPTEAQALTANLVYQLLSGSPSSRFSLAYELCVSAFSRRLLSEKT